MTNDDPPGYTVDELREELQRIDSVETLESLLAAERQGRDRAAAREAIEARIEAVAGASDDADVAASDEADGAATDDADGTGAEGTTDADGASTTAADGTASDDADRATETDADEGASTPADAATETDAATAADGGSPGVADRIGGLPTGGVDAAGLVGRSPALDRLFGDALDEPVAETRDFATAFGLLAALGLWAAATAAIDSPLWSLLVAVVAVLGAGLVVRVATAAADADAPWLAGSLVGAAYFAVGVGLVVVSVYLQLFEEFGVAAVDQMVLFTLFWVPLRGFRGLFAPMVAVVAVQAAALALVFEAYSRPVVPAGGLDGTSRSQVSLHAANWWRVAGVGVALALVLVVGLPGWVGGGRLDVGSAGLAWLFLPTAGAVAALVVYVLRKAAALERIPADD